MSFPWATAADTTSTTDATNPTLTTPPPGHNDYSAETNGGTRETGGFLSFDAESEDWQMANGECEKTQEELQEDLRQLEDEINTLKQVLHVKEKRANDIRRKLGVTPIQLISDSFYGGLKNITSSTAVQKTSENVKYFGQSYLVPGSKTAASYTKSGLSNLGTGVVSGMGSIKNSRLFSSMYGIKPNPSEEEKFVEVIAPPDLSGRGESTPSSSSTTTQKTTESQSAPNTNTTVAAANQS